MRTPISIRMTDERDVLRLPGWMEAEQDVEISGLGLLRATYDCDEPGYCPELTLASGVHLEGDALRAVCALAAMMGRTVDVYDAPGHGATLLREVPPCGCGSIYGPGPAHASTCLWFEPAANEAAS